MFVADIQVSKALQPHKRKLQDLERDIEKPNLAFERKVIRVDLASGVDKLGSLITGGKGRTQVLKQQAKPYNTNSVGELKDRMIKSRSEVTVKSQSDKETPWISDCIVMPSGHVVTCDYENNRIKLLDVSWTITGQLKLPDPWDVSILDSSHVIVS